MWEQRKLDHPSDERIQAFKNKRASDTNFYAKTFTKRIREQKKQRLYQELDIFKKDMIGILEMSKRPVLKRKLGDFKL